MIENWIDVIRAHEYFNLLGLNQNNKIELTKIAGGDYTVVTEYDYVFEVKIVPSDFEEKYGTPPNYIGASYCRNYLDSENQPDSSASVAAQQAGNISFFWTNKYSNSNLGGNPNPFSAYDDFKRHRSDWWPASIEMINVQKYYSSGLLHRNSNRPAIRADYIIASWYEEGCLYRANGPAIINLRGYKEYWKDGKYSGYDMDNHTLTWKTTMKKDMEDSEYERMMEFVEESNGTDLFTNHYFSSPDDEFCFIAEFSSYD